MVNLNNECSAVIVQKLLPILKIPGALQVHGLISDLLNTMHFVILGRVATLCPFYFQKSGIRGSKANYDDRRIVQ